MRQNNLCLSYSFGSWLMRERCAGSCRIALMSVANKKGVVVDPTPLSKWAYVEFSAVKVAEELRWQKVATRGLQPHLRFGRADFSADLGWWLTVDTDPEADGAMALYIYAVGPPFEVILNNHMITN